MNVISNKYLTFKENVPRIPLTDLKSIIHDQNNITERENKINKLKEKIDGIIKEDCWSFDDIFLDHNYCSLDSSIFECVVYFLAG